jgi:CBS domain-containing protein
MHTLTLRAIGSEDLPIPGTDPWYADPCDPALSVMTDFRERTSITVSENATIDAALEHMRHTGVRCAFAIEDDRRVMVGLITAYDIMSEKPIRHVRAVAGRWRDVRVRDIMQSIVDWRVADIREIERLTVADVVQVFNDPSTTHVPVVELTDGGERRLRGLLSAAKVKRLLLSRAQAQLDGIMADRPSSFPRSQGADHVERR